MRTFLVVMDESDDANAALRYASLRAARTGGAVEILAIIEKPEFVQWSGVQAAMEEEAQLRAEARVAAATGEVFEEAGIRPSITVRHGPEVKAVTEFLKEREGAVSALVLGASDGPPGPLHTHFAGTAAATLPCPLIIVPARLDEEAIQRLAA